MDEDVCVGSALAVRFSTYPGGRGGKERAARNERSSDWPRGRSPLPRKTFLSGAPCSGAAKNGKCRARGAPCPGTLNYATSSSCSGTLLDVGAQPFTKHRVGLRAISQLVLSDELLGQRGACGFVA